MISSSSSSPQGIGDLVLAVDENVAATLAASLFQLLTGTLFPFIGITCCNMAIIITLSQASKQRRELRNMAAGSGSKETQHLTRMLIFISIAYVIFSILFRLLAVASMAYDFGQICDFIHYNMLAALLFTIWCWNHSANFYLYCLGGGRRYREDLKEVLRQMACLPPRK